MKFITRFFFVGLDLIKRLENASVEANRNKVYYYSGF